MKPIYEAAVIQIEVTNACNHVCANCTRFVGHHRKSFFTDLEKAFGRNSPFYKHMTRSKIEFLKGVKSLLDERIERLEKKDSKKTGAKMTKVKVE